MCGNAGFSSFSLLFYKTIPGIAIKLNEKFSREYYSPNPYLNTSHNIIIVIFLHDGD